MRRLAYIFIVFGISFLLLSAFLYWERNTPNRIAFKLNEINSAANPTKTDGYYSIQPTVLMLPSLGIELPVIPTELLNGKWQATPAGISYLTSSPLPGDIGNSIFYAHNWPNLLGKLPKVKPGDNITVKFSDNSTKEFLIEYTLVVTPDQSHILNPTDDRRLTLYTCTGFLDTRRFVAVGILKS